MAALAFSAIAFVVSFLLARRGRGFFHGANAWLAGFVAAIAATFGWLILLQDVFGHPYPVDPRDAIHGAGTWAALIGPTLGTFVATIARRRSRHGRH